MISTPQNDSERHLLQQDEDPTRQHLSEKASTSPSSSRSSDAVIARVTELATPIASARDAELYDVEFVSGVLRVTIDRSSGIDIDAIGEISQALSAALDHTEIVPGDRYLLEVSSPGIERKLRLPRHFAQQVGERIAVKTRKAMDGKRRFEGTLLHADDTGISLDITALDATTLNATNNQKRGQVRDEQRDQVERDPHHIIECTYDQIDSARALFDWKKELQDHT